MNNSDLEQQLAKKSAKLNSLTAELEAFTYSISHDLTSKKSKALIDIGPLNKDGHHGLYIKDNGVGFKILNNETPFRPFKRYHHPDEFPGTGLGLALVNRIISLHNGRL